MINLIVYILYIYIFNIKNYDKDYIGRNLKQISIDYGTLGIKIGQVFSNRTDILDREICDNLNDLRDNVPGLTKSDNQLLIQDIKSSLPIKSITEEPIGAGCIAVVYQAVLKNDQKIVIKIKRPNILEELNKSIRKIERILSYLNYLCLLRNLELSTRLEELKQLIFNQLDFENELNETNYFYNKYKKHTFIRTPKPFLEYSDKSKIVLEFIEGKKIDDLDEKTKEDISLPLTGLLISSMFIDGHYHGDLHTGNMMVTGKKLCIYDFGLVCKFNNDEDKEIAYNYYMFLMNKKWDEASDILLNKMCENEIKNPDQFKKDTIKILITHFEINDKWDPISYVRDISKCIHNHGSTMSKSFVTWELSMITVQGAIAQICKKNIWELCREINNIYSLND